MTIDKIVEDSGKVNRKSPKKARNQATPPTIYDRVKEDILNSVDIVDVARDYSIEIPDANRNNIMTSCPLHPHQGTKCFSINAHKGLFSCFSSHHSGEINSGDCINLVRMLEGCGYVDALEKLAERYRPDLLAAFSNGNGNGNKATSTNPALSKAIRDLWQGRGVKYLPESVVVKSSEVQYLTYTQATSNGKPDTALFQHVFPSNLTKRLAPKGALQHELYVPRPWDSYKGCSELYLVEGIPDTFTYLNFGKKAVGAFNNGSVDRELFQQELKTFLEYIEPQKVVIVPDPDAFSQWQHALTSFLDGYALEWIDVSLWHVEPSKLDSNALLQECAGNRRDFFRALSWCRKNSNPCQKTIGKKVLEKRPDGYFEIQEEGEPKRLTNFSLYYRSFARDAESQEGRVEVTFQYGGNRRRVTKVVETKVLGDAKKFQEVLASVKHTLFVNELRALHFFEESNYQYFDEVQSFDKFGQLTDDLVLFKNVAICKGKAFYANKNGIIALPDRAVCTLADDAPSLTLTSDNGVNEKLVSTLYSAYGLNGVLSLAFDLASIRMKSIVDRYGNHALKFLHGEPGIGKTKLETEIKKLFGISRALTARDTRASLERVCQKYQYLPIPIHEWKPEHEEATDFLEKAYDRHIKNRAETDNTNKVKKNELAAFLTVSSNYVPTPKTALHTRNAYLSFQKTAFNKKSLNALESLVARSDIVLRTYLVMMDIASVHTEARAAIGQLNDDARTVNNYAPFLVGLAILKEVGAMSDATYKQYRKEFLETLLPDTLTNITEDTLVEDFLQELHNKAIQVKHTNQYRQGMNVVDVEYETEINPQTHYILREKAETRYLILDLSSCVAAVNKGNRAQFDKKVLQQALKDSPYFYQQPTLTKVEKSTKYKAIWLYLDTIETRLGLTFRTSMADRPVNMALTDENDNSV